MVPAADIQLVRNESDNFTVNRALRVLDGQVLQAIDIEPDDGRTRFTFDLGCSLLTCPARPGTYRTEPVKQWMLYSHSGPDLVVLSVRGDGTYSIIDGHAKPEGEHWPPSLREQSYGYANDGHLPPGIPAFAPTIVLFAFASSRSATAIGGANPRPAAAQRQRTHRNTELDNLRTRWPIRRTPVDADWTRAAASERNV